MTALSDFGSQDNADITTALRMACLTEDRTNAEQKGLLRLARKLDTQANRLASHNTTMWKDDHQARTVTRLLPESRLEQMVDATRELGDGDKAVTLRAKRDRAPLAKQVPEGWTLIEYGERGTFADPDACVRWSEDVVHTGGLV